MRSIRSMLFGGLLAPLHCGALLPSSSRVAAARFASSPRMAVTPSAMPKSETGVDALLDEYPYADGRGTLVAVLDTGCDLTAAGLLTTSDGKPKYVDFIDCTSGGDIDTSKTASVDADGTVLGLSGRKLQLGAWADGVAEFRLGAVRLFDVLPSSAARRVKAERKASFEAEQHTTVTRVQRELDALAGASGEADKAAKTELELQLKELKGLMDGYDDAGPQLSTGQGGVLVAPQLAAMGSSGGTWRAGAALRSPEERLVTSDPTKRP